jgi:hypothetical protein
MACLHSLSTEQPKVSLCAGFFYYNNVCYLQKAANPLKAFKNNDKNNGL